MYQIENLSLVLISEMVSCMIVQTELKTMTIARFKFDFIIIALIREVSIELSDH